MENSDGGFFGRTLAQNERIRGKSHRLKLIGEFFVDLTLHLFGGTKKSNFSAALGDIHSDELDVEMEVKGWGSSNPLKIRDQQLTNHLELFGFPREHYLYVLFGYVYRPKKQANTISKATPTKRSLDEFLAERTRFMYVLDIRILEALRGKLGTVEQQFCGYRQDIVRIGRLELKKFQMEPIETIRRLKLKPSMFAISIQEITTEFRELPMRFQATVIVPKKLSRSSGHLLLRTDNSYEIDLAGKT